ncbi:Inner membrane protein YgaP [Phycisphaerales bacterium]|nr:Inner membrane protein YgaP [Phycisphaerales bacterium]
MTTTAVTGTKSDVYSDAAHSKPVMRQTQGMIGVVLLGGVGAAYLVDPAWVALPAIVGVGLVFAGLTGNCPMASFIARLPWNRGSGGGSGATDGCCGGGCR